MKEDAENQDSEELEEVEMPLQEFTTSESTEVMVDNPNPMSDASAPSTAFAASTEALAIVEAPSHPHAFPPPPQN